MHKVAAKRKNLEELNTTENSLLSFVPNMTSPEGVLLPYTFSATTLTV